MSQTATAPQPKQASAADHAELGHVVPVSTLLATCVALMVLTFITVAATWVQLGYFNLWIALIIATIKAALVCLYFMHLRWDRPFNAIVLVSAVGFMLIFLGGALTDTGAYNSEIEWKESAFRVKQEAESKAPEEAAAEEAAAENAAGLPESQPSLSPAPKSN